MSEPTTIEELLLHCLKDLHSAETQLLKALPVLASASADEALSSAFKSHFEETKSHILRLEQAAELLGQSPHGATCLAMKGLIAEGQEILQTFGPGPIRDLAIAGAARKVEHYEIAGYCGAKELAEAVGRLDVVVLLQTTEDEEKSTEKLLGALAAKVVGGSPSDKDPTAG